MEVFDWFHEAKDEKSRHKCFVIFIEVATEAAQDTRSAAPQKRYELPQLFPNELLFVAEVKSEILGYFSKVLPVEL